MARKIFPQTNRIKSIREDKHWSQELVAQGAGISTRTYQRIEAGEGCSIESLKNIAAMFDMNFKELLLSDTAPQEEFQASWLRALRRFV